MVNLKNSVFKRLLKLADKFDPEERDFYGLSQTPPAFLIHRAVELGMKMTPRGAETPWLRLLGNGETEISRYHSRYFYARVTHRLENIFDMLVKILGENFKLNQTIYIFGADKMIHPTLPNAYAMALTPQQIAEKNIGFVPCFTFHNWGRGKITDYTQATTSIAAAGDLPYTDERIFWRGYGANLGRPELLAFGAERPFCNFTDSRSSSFFVPMAQQPENKYLIDVRGWGYSGRLKYLFFSKRPIFVIERPWVEFWHDKLIPWEHFIPVREDLSDLEENWKKVEGSTDLYQQLAQGGFAFAQKHLTYDAMVDFFKGYYAERGI